ncbi:MAG: hypothetical protein GY711_31585 [bacterium]|nr:hypothetical protein [bacterium]
MKHTRTWSPVLIALVTLGAGCASSPSQPASQPDAPEDAAPIEAVPVSVDPGASERGSAQPVAVEYGEPYYSPPVVYSSSRSRVPDLTGYGVERRGEASLRRKLDLTRVERFVVKDEESLRTVVDSIRDMTGLPLVVTPAAETAALDEGVVFNFQLQNSITVKNLLNLIKSQTDGTVVWKIKHDAVLVTTAEKALDQTSLVTHDIRALTMVKTDFIAPRIDRLRLLDELEDDDGGGPFGTIGEQARSMEEDDVAALVQENIAAGTWDQDGISIEAANGFLFVRHTPEVQRKIANFLLRMAP